MNSSLNIIQSKSRVQLRSSGCTKQMGKLVFGRLIEKVLKVGLSGWWVQVCSAPAQNWWSSCLDAWELRWDNQLHHQPIAAWVSGFCRAGEAFGGVWTPFCRDTLYKICANCTLLGLGDKKKREICKQKLTSTIISKLYFSPICSNVSVKRNSFHKYCMGEGTAWYRELAGKTTSFPLDHVSRTDGQGHSTEEGKLWEQEEFNQIFMHLSSARWTHERSRATAWVKASRIEVFFFFVKICISSLPFCLCSDCLWQGSGLWFRIISHVVDLNFIHSIACWD